MKFNLKDKVFLVSGSSKGIGKGIAKVMAEEGANVVLNGRNESTLLETRDDLEQHFPDQILAHKGDITNNEVLESMKDTVISRWGKIDGIVANAGNIKETSSPATEEDWLWYLNNNLYIAIRFIDHFLDNLIENKGSIVIISSIAGLEDLSAPIPYNVSKAALNVYSKSLAKRLGEHGVRVNTVAPGNIMFNGGNWEKRMKSHPEEVKNMINEKVALKTFGDPSDIGSITAFLLSNKAKFITGATFVVDGGQTSSF